MFYSLELKTVDLCKKAAEPKVLFSALNPIILVVFTKAAVVERFLLKQILIFKEATINK